MARKKLMKVLLIEDDPDTQFIVKAVLEEMNQLRVKTCASGQDGVAKATEWHPDLILLDVRLPDMDGLATLQALREIPETKGTPVIFMTAHPPKLSDYKELGVLHVMQKPFDPFVLSVAIESIWKSEKTPATAVPKEIDPPS